MFVMIALRSDATSGQMEKQQTMLTSPWCQIINVVLKMV